MNTNKTSAVAAILLIFLAGGVIGGLGGYFFQRQRVSRLIEEAGTRSRSGLPPHIMSRISRELELTSDQQTRADQIFAQYGEEMRELKSRFRPEFTQIMNRGFDALNEILTPDQQTRLTRLKDRMSRRRHHRSDMRRNQGDGCPGGANCGPVSADPASGENGWRGRMNEQTGNRMSGHMGDGMRGDDPDRNRHRHRLFFQMARMAAEIRLQPDQVEAGAVILRDLARESRFQRRQAPEDEDLSSEAAIAKFRRDADPILRQAAETLSPEQMDRLEAILPDLLAP